MKHGLGHMRSSRIYRDRLKVGVVGVNRGNSDDDTGLLLVQGVKGLSRNMKKREGDLRRKREREKSNGKIFSVTLSHLSAIPNPVSLRFFYMQ